MQGSIELTTATRNTLPRLADDIAKTRQNLCVQKVKFYHDGIQKGGKVEDEAGDMGICTDCRRNSAVADHINVALREMNEVVRSLNDDLDFISWLIAQKIEYL